MRTLKKKILIVEDNEYVLESIKLLLSKEGYSIATATDGHAAIELSKKERYDLVITDIKMPQMDGMELLQRLKGEFPDISVIMMTAFGSIKNAVGAMKMGACDYITKPVSSEEIKLVIQKVFEKQDLATEVKALREELKGRYKLDNIIGKNQKMQDIYDLILNVSSTDATILIMGETGTGKELVARSIHFNSERENKPFVTINCSALPEALLESELFGHEQGAFTGAIKQRLGKFELADGGTIFFDEMGDLLPSIQTKLLRVLQEREFERVGGNQTIKVDVRIIAATNKDLSIAIKQGTFREDLYYRLNVIPIILPPLRERKEDIPLLAAHFLKKCCAILKKDVRAISQEIMNAMISYNWPGNIRELENLIERAVIMAKKNIITDINLSKEGARTIALLDGFTISFDDSHITELMYEDFIGYCEKQYITKALEKYHGRVDLSAKSAMMDKKTFYRKMKKHAINRKAFKKSKIP
ncbi:MAG: sigma-54-dependent transcriptional regulator [Candidatus Brocadiales bacterium]